MIPVVPIASTAGPHRLLADGRSARDVHPEAVADCDLAFEMLSRGIER